MRLFHLPMEIQEAIVAQVASPASLANLARVCRQLQPLAERILYQSVYLRNGTGDKFAYAIDRAPNRAMFVRELLIHYHYVDVPDEESYYPFYAESLAPTIGRLVNLQSLVVKGLEYDAPREYDDDTTEGFERVIEEAEKWRHLFTQSAVSGSRILPSLTKCVLAMNDLDHSEPPWSFDMRASVMIHPHLQDLTIVGARISSMEESLMASRRSTELESLVLVCCDVSSRSIHDLLSLPRGLKHLAVKGAAWTVRPYYYMKNRQEYIDALSIQAESLTSLDMDFPPGVPDNPALDFRALQRLQKLTVDPQALRGDGKFDPVSEQVCLWENSEPICRLPPTIQHLVFFEYHEAKTPDLHTLLLVYNWISQGSLPNLRSITVKTARSSADAILNRGFEDNSGRSFYEAFQTFRVELRAERTLSSTENGYRFFDCHCGYVSWRIAGIHFIPVR
ncbi:hypothetical protein BO71DRAFT_487722 [Aspergillus ellipticus CBS 707.79]|uniref:F-box domain-containing protein n=1 Tax=Aspergillus ellipticus CBS 707.79 TaxID=1448320 RepID=A0A319EF85_9EURO|nr:hypothetical protein BO71DRAFT_487722 [Aspergillus ellipticus CBS 707.79]